MYNGLLRILNNHNIPSVNQYGFRKHHPTAYALACLYDKISTAIENKEYITFQLQNQSVMVFEALHLIDSSKAI